MHTALIYNTILMKVRIKENGILLSQYGLKEGNGRFSIY